MSWRGKLNINRPPDPTRVTSTDEVVLGALARPNVGIEPLSGASENPVDGAWGDDPDSWLNDLRSRLRADF